MTPSPLTAVRRHCLACCAGSANEVALCQSQRCPLWAMRFGHRPDAMSAQRLYPLERPMPPDGLTTLAAIKRRCLDCSDGTAAGAKGCAHTGCDLWSFRMGRNPNRAGVGRKDGLFAGKLPTHRLAGRDDGAVATQAPEPAAGPVARP
jgi:hypothetical protein